MTESLHDKITNVIQETLEETFKDLSSDLWQISDATGDFEFRLPHGEKAVLNIDKLGHDVLTIVRTGLT